MTRLQHWLFTLRAALSDDYAKLASGGGQPFPGGIPVYPLSSCREFWVFRDPPISLGLSWRDGTTDFADNTDKEGITVQGVFTRRVATKEVLYQETGQPNRRLELEGELADLEFGLRISFGSRVSGFGFRISAWGCPLNTRNDAKADTDFTDFH